MRLSFHGTSVCDRLYPEHLLPELGKVPDGQGRANVAAVCNSTQSR